MVKHPCMKPKDQKSSPHVLPFKSVFKHGSHEVSSGRYMYAQEMSKERGCYYNAGNFEYTLTN